MRQIARQLQRYLVADGGVCFHQRDEIRAEKYVFKNNQEAFQQLAVAAAPVYVARSSNPDGTLIPRGYCLYIPNAQGADFKDGTGRIFFASSRPESELKQLLDLQQQP